MERDHNLLFGVLAAQLRKVTPARLAEIASAWAADPSRGLGDALLAAGAVSVEDKALLDGIVAATVENFGGDASRALEAFGGEEQVYHAFRGAVVMTDSGNLRSVAPARSADDAEAVRPDDVPGVEEAPARYTFKGEHGRGGMGRVLLVHDEILGRDLALKELLPDGADPDAPGAGQQPTPVRMTIPAVARFLQEARITGQLEHPSIVPVYELGYRKDGTLYYTMKLVRGKTLQQALDACKSLEDRLKLLPHFVDLCNAIAYAHSRGVIHRDIKPGNVMIGEFGETVVLDWGLAKARNQKDIHAAELQESVKGMSLGDLDSGGHTKYGEILGTPVYMPPEQAKGDLDSIDERSDIYSLGAVLYEILTGKPPFSGQNVMHTLYRVINETPDPVQSHARHCPPDLIQFCNRAMNKIAPKRYQSAKELADAVEGSKLRPPKSRLKKYTQRAAIFLVLFIPTCTTVLNVKSDRDLASLKAHYEAQGIPMTGGYWEIASGIPAGEKQPDPDVDPLGALYALEWQYPNYIDRINYTEQSPFSLGLEQQSPYALNLKNDEVARLRFMVDRYADLLQQVRHIARMQPAPMSRGVQHLLQQGNLQSWEIPIPRLLGLRCCANLLWYQAVLALHDGDPELALETCLDIFRFSNHLDASPMLISAMIRVALINIGHNALQDVLHQGPITSESAALLQETLEQFSQATLENAFRGELAFWLDALSVMREHPGKVIHALYSFDMPLTLRQTMRMRMTHIGALFYGSHPFRFWLNGDASVGIRYLGQAICAVRKPYDVAYPELLRLGNEKDEQLSRPWAGIRYPFAQVGLAIAHRSYAQWTTVVGYNQLALLALGIKQHHEEQGIYPETLAALVPDYMSVLPMDPISETLYIYEYDEHGFTLYGVGTEDSEVRLGQLRRTKPRGYERTLTRALEDYLKEHEDDADPADVLDMICRERFSTEPVDFMTGLPLTYAITDNKPQLMTLHPNGTMAPLQPFKNIVWIGW